MAWRVESSYYARKGLQTPWFLSVCDIFVHYCRRPYRVEYTGSLLTSAVKRRRARLVLGWGTAREDLRVLSAFPSASILFRMPSRSSPARPGLAPAGRGWAGNFAGGFECGLLQDHVALVRWLPATALCDETPHPPHNPPFDPGWLEPARAGRDRPGPLQKNCLHFSICACHPCAGAMLIFSVSFQF